MSGRKLKVAVTQAEPEWLDLASTVEKTIHLINEAARNGARLIAFPECWIPGYPGWICDRAAAKTNQIAISLGFSERSDSHSLYISQVIIDTHGDTIMHRRKIKPTHMERTIFGDGHSQDLVNVAAINFGGEIGVVRVGSLNCWEHTQPLLKYNTYSQLEDIHIAAWPPINPDGGVESSDLWSVSAEGVECLSQAYAVESGSFVLHSTAVCSEKCVERLKTKDGLLCQKLGGGHSAVYGPDGRRVTKPLADSPSTEGIVYAELSLDAIVTNRCFFDVVGHYSRPDLLWLGVDQREKQVVVPRKNRD